MLPIRNGSHVFAQNWILPTVLQIDLFLCDLPYFDVDYITLLEIIVLDQLVLFTGSENRFIALYLK